MATVTLSVVPCINSQYTVHHTPWVMIQSIEHIKISYKMTGNQGDTVDIVASKDSHSYLPSLLAPFVLILLSQYS